MNKSKFLRALGERVSEERARLGFTQAQVAEFGAVTRRTQINYETGERAPDAAYLTSLAARGFDALYIVVGRREATDLTAQLGVAEPNADYRVTPLKPANVRAAALAVFEAMVNKTNDPTAASPTAAQAAEAIIVLARMSETAEDVQRNAAHVLQLLKK